MVIAQRLKFIVFFFYFQFFPQHKDIILSFATYKMHNEYNIQFWIFYLSN